MTFWDEFTRLVLEEERRQVEAEEKFLELINRPMPVNEDGTITFKLIHAKDLDERVD
jgi:hypothetical protein